MPIIVIFLIVGVVLGYLLHKKSKNRKMVKVVVNQVSLVFSGLSSDSSSQAQEDLEAQAQQAQADQAVKGVQSKKDPWTASPHLKKEPDAEPSIMVRGCRPAPVVDAGPDTMGDFEAHKKKYFDSANLTADDRKRLTKFEVDQVFIAGDVAKPAVQDKRAYRSFQDPLQARQVQHVQETGVNLGMLSKVTPSRSVTVCTPSKYNTARLKWTRAQLNNRKTGICNTWATFILTLNLTLSIRTLAPAR